jgi:hypothetical protein
MNEGALGAGSDEIQLCDGLVDRVAGGPVLLQCRFEGPL